MRKSERGGADILQTPEQQDHAKDHKDDRFDDWRNAGNLLDAPADQANNAKHNENIEKRCYH